VCVCVCVCVCVYFIHAFRNDALRPKYGDRWSYNRHCTKISNRDIE